MKWIGLCEILFALVLIARPGRAEELVDEVDVYYFYDRSLNHPGTGSPNWFHYWSQFVPKGSANAIVYDERIRTENDAYGGTNPFTRKIGVSSLASEYNNETGHRGLHTFYEVIAHELKHLTLWDERWPDGYDPKQDPDGDFYPDLWEISDPQAKKYGFRVNQDDTYDPIRNTSGYRYEEDICRAQEQVINEAIFDSQDWSYDPTGQNQGKMWQILPDEVKQP